VLRLIVFFSYELGNINALKIFLLINEEKKVAPDYIANFFKYADEQFNDITAEDVMTPRMEMFCLPQNIRLNDALSQMLKQQHSRIPLYENTRDNIVGVVHIMEVVEALGRKRNPLMKQLSYKPYFVPEHKVINDLFKEFQEKQVHMAIVVDEYGGTAGIVTVEDLIEEIVGEISDEYDIEETHIRRINKKIIQASGIADVKEINKFFNVRIPGKKTDTIGAFLLKKLKKIPRQGETFRMGGVTIYIEEATRKTIKRVLIFKGIRNGELKEKIEEITLK